MFSYWLECCLGRIQVSNGNRLAKGHRTRKLRVSSTTRLPAGQLLLHHVAINAAAPVVEELQRAGHFLPDRDGNDGRHDQLRMGVLQRRSRRRSLVFKDQSVNEPRISLEVDEPVPKDPQHLADIVDRQPRHVGFMMRTFDDDFVCPDSVHEVVNPVAPLVEIALDLQCGEPVGNDASPPAAVISLGARMSIREDFRRRRIFVPLAKGAKPGRVAALNSRKNPPAAWPGPEPK